MINYIILLLTRLGTVIPMTIFLVKVLKRFRNKLRNLTLDKTAKGMAIVSLSLIAEGVLFGIYDGYRLFNNIPTQSPLWIIIIWMAIRFTLLVGVIIMFSIMFEGKDEE